MGKGTFKLKFNHRMQTCILCHYIAQCNTKPGYSFMLRSRNQTTNQIPRSYKNDGFDWPFDVVIVT